LFLGVLLLFPLAHGLRSKILTGSFLMMPVQGGVNFYIGNNPYADGMTAIVPGTRPSWEGGYDDTIGIAESSAGRKLAAAEISAYWFKQGLDYAVAHPGRTVLMWLRKARLVFNNDEISNNQNVYHAVRSTVVLQFLPGFALFAPLAAAGAVLFFRDKSVLLLTAVCALYLASFLPFFMNGRFRLPVVPFVIVLAAAAAVRIARVALEAWRTVRSPAKATGGARALLPVFKALAVPALAAVILAANNTPVIGYDDGDYEMAITWLRKGEAARARQMFLKTRVLPEPFGSLSDVSLGSISVAAGDMREAAGYFSAALAKNPMAKKDIEEFLGTRRLRYRASPEPAIVPGN
jgi:hypothetical protein